MELIDIGVNLTHPSLANRLEGIVQNAQSAGIIHQIITGTCITSSKQALQIAVSKPDYFSSTAGCHPHDAKDFEDQDEQLLVELSKKSSVVAIGECGLDFNRNFSPQNIQQQVFECQIEIACKEKLPLFMHQRDAHDRFIDILSHYKNRLSAGVIHCFTGDKRQLKDCLDLGLQIGITGWLCDERRSIDLQEAVKYLPLDRMMLETDSPYLIPRNMTEKPKSRSNVPANLPWVARKLCQLIEIPVEVVAQETTNNARKFFGLSI